MEGPLGVEPRNAGIKAQCDNRYAMALRDRGAPPAYGLHTISIFDVNSPVELLQLGDSFQNLTAGIDGTLAHEIRRSRP